MVKRRAETFLCRVRSDAWIGTFFWD